MVRIKVFTPNENGKIELTKEELENLLNESYRHGWNDHKPSYYDFYYNSTPYYCDGLTSDTAKNHSISNGSSSFANQCGEALEKHLETLKTTLKEYEVKTV